MLSVTSSQKYRSVEPWALLDEEMQLILCDAATAVFVEVVEALLEVGVVLQLHLVIVFSGPIFNERYVDVILKLLQI